MSVPPVRSEQEDSVEIERTLMIAWAALFIALAGAAALLIAYSDSFAWHVELIDMPARQLAAGGVLSGLAFLALRPLIIHSKKIPPNQQTLLLAIIVAIGLALRIAMFWTTPALEDDFYRYLWDGTVTAHGLNPYAITPHEALFGTTSGPSVDNLLSKLASQSPGTMERVNHPHLKTIYPAIAQLAFAAAHLIEPWSLSAWRFVCLAGEIATFGLILLLLWHIGRPLLWSALYWLNPLVIKELMNSGHMEAIVLPLVMATLYLAVRQRHLSSATVLALAIGAKLWPAVLIPLVLRPLLPRPIRLATAIAIIAAIVGLCAIPVWLGGINQSSGFVAFATYWQTNSALFQTLQTFAHSLFASSDWSDVASNTPTSNPVPGLVVRAGLAAILVMATLHLARPPITDDRDLMHKAALSVAALFLLSPAQFPWYATWIAIFLPFMPLWGLLTLSVTLPIYYLSFHQAAHHDYTLFNRWYLWLIWLPIWWLLARDALSRWRYPLTWSADA